MQNESRAGIWQHRRPLMLRSEDRIATTGQHCPTTGTWATPSWPQAAIVLLQGELMPPLNDRAVDWHYQPDMTDSDEPLWDGP